MPDHPQFPVSVVTPEGPAFEGEAEMLIVPGAAGEIGVLARHAPLAAGDIDEARARRQLEEAQDELAKVDAGESTADRWQLEQRIRHAENQLTVSGAS